MSEFSCPVVKIDNIRKHPNADALEIVDVFETPVIVRKGQLKLGDLAVYVPVESVIPMTNPVFQGLGIKSDKDKYRVKAVRLRGEYSEGLLVPVNGPYADEGEDAAPTLGIVKYEEPEVPERLQGKAGGQQEKDLPYIPKYSMENLLKNRDAIPDGTMVVVTEKIHGSNCRFMYGKDPHGIRRLNVGSHNVWKRPMYWGRPTFTAKAKVWVNRLMGKQVFSMPVLNDDVWWQTAKNLDLENKLRKLPEGWVLYGEVFGKVQDLKYSVDGIDFRLFDVYKSGVRKWASYTEVVQIATYLGIKPVPTLYVGPYSKDAVDYLRNGLSVLDNKTIREGIVIKPLSNDGHHIAFKLVGEDYKLRKNGTEYH